MAGPSRSQELRLDLPRGCKGPNCGVLVPKINETPSGMSAFPFHFYKISCYLVTRPIFSSTNPVCCSPVTLYLTALSTNPLKPLVPGPAHHRIYQSPRPCTATPALTLRKQTFSFSPFLPSWPPLQRLPVGLPVITAGVPSLRLPACGLLPLPCLLSFLLGHLPRGS